MNYTIDNHPDEDVLSAWALEEQCDSIELHLDICSTCREFVEDIRAVRDEIASIEDVETPVSLNRILSIVRDNKKAKRFPLFIQDWYKRPFVYGIITALAAILSYVIFIFFV